MTEKMNIINPNINNNRRKKHEERIKSNSKLKQNHNLKNQQIMITKTMTMKNSDVKFVDNTLTLEMRCSNMLRKKDMLLLKRNKFVLFPNSMCFIFQISVNAVDFEIAKVIITNIATST